MYSTYFIPSFLSSFLPGVTLKPCAAITAAEEHNGEGGVRNGIPHLRLLGPSTNPSDAAVATALEIASQQFLHCISNSHFFQVARSLARGGLKGREGERRRVGWLVFCAATI